ncbi:hypothetical protein GCM10010254_57530 [Streptomyces chromofuscus]|nr:hypothetical protein GCM10010254_57530 [Streptomyces chromofuscus]
MHPTPPAHATHTASHDREIESLTEFDEVVAAHGTWPDSASGPSI